PKKACTILDIDSLPDVRRKIDKIKESALQGSQATLRGKIQKVEQGMGRGIHSKDDYCVVFLMGHSLVSHLYVHDAISNFTPATKKQFELSNEIGRASCRERVSITQEGGASKREERGNAARERGDAA